MYVCVWGGVSQHFQVHMQKFNRIIVDISLS